MARTVSIVGLSPSSRDLAFAEPPGEMWSVNTGHFCFDREQLTRFTRWFQLHPRRDFEAANADRPQHLEWLRHTTIPVYMEQVWEDIPTSVRYPREEIALIGGDYFTSSVAYMLALAIYERFGEIRLFGVDMPSETEYFNERPCVEYWLGVAVANGIKVVTPEHCPLMRGRRYAETVQITSSLLNEKIRLHTRNRNDKRSAFDEACGAVRALESVLALAPDLPGLADRVKAERRKMDVLGGEYNAYCGAVQALTELYIDALRPEGQEARKLRTAAGGFLALAGNGRGPA